VQSCTPGLSFCPNESQEQFKPNGFLHTFARIIHSGKSDKKQDVRFGLLVNLLRCKDFVWAKSTPKQTPYNGQMVRP
jgi:hypothetical protein